MITVCAWCNPDWQPGEEQATHGICPKCFWGLVWELAFEKAFVDCSTLVFADTSGVIYDGRPGSYSFYGLNG